MVGDEHYRVARDVQRILQAYKSLQDIIAILGMDELSEADNWQSLEQERYKDFYTTFFCCRGIYRISRKTSRSESTIKGFDAICKGEYDHLPEAAFYMVGGIDEAIEKADKLAKDSK